MHKIESCPYEDNCLLLEKDFNKNCEICQACRKGMPDEYAVHVKNTDGLSELHGFSELPSIRLNPKTDRVTIYSLSGKPYYSNEVISFQPSTASEKSALHALVSTW